jgi:hypothetical protein
LLKASVGAELFDEESHPVSTKAANSTDNVAVGASMCRRDTIDLRHGLSVKFERVSSVVPETAMYEYYCARPTARFLLDLHVQSLECRGQHIGVPLGLFRSPQTSARRSLRLNALASKRFGFPFFCPSISAARTASIFAPRSCSRRMRSRIYSLSLV